MPFENLWYWLEGFGFAVTIRESMWIFPVIETLHVVTLAITVGSIAYLDLRLLGAAWRQQSVMATAAEVLPWTWGAFIATVVSGFLMFASAASYYVIVPAFRYKLLFLLLAGINMLVLHFGAWRQVTEWTDDTLIPPAAKGAAVLSLVFWSGTVVFGRWTGFF